MDGEGGDAIWSVHGSLGCVVVCVCWVVFDWGKGGEALSWGVFVGVVFELDEKGLLLMAQGLGTA